LICLYACLIFIVICKIFYSIESCIIHLNELYFSINNATELTTNSIRKWHLNPLKCKKSIYLKCFKMNSMYRKTLTGYK